MATVNTDVVLSIVFNSLKRTINIRPHELIFLMI